ncbi:hypothetical protein [Burkholderia vietnamiensis]|uniref:hypothetical protein n=1 Tax=Burkholderia vietnamiensis TaxID=60552 RepID=UPI00075DD82A|nr:hypothetical protein [Burkholderia vietnamiensis]KVF68203.1 hypothetical protein WJ17_14290 [Burkholderia vietnamiensis]
MEDFAYLCADSNAAWLAGRGDGRYERYERFYHAQRATHADGFDLEQINEQYGEWAGRRSAAALAAFNAPWVGKVAVACCCAYLGSHIVPVISARAPQATNIMLAAAFIGMRIFHRRRKAT